ncbi:MAG: GNAT family N-acetyltransferase [Bryobacteraceae bacterium]|jgi:GNAT superfamily N-acetyltransferase
MIEVRELTSPEGRRYLGALAQVLVDCVDGGASVSFMPPFSQADAEGFFDSVLSEVEARKRILLAAFVDGQLVGTVQIVHATPPNQVHRADIAKLLVMRSARAQGIGAGLMEQAEESARRAGKTLLVLDTCADTAADRLYTRLGWTRVGIIPKYALNPDGSWCDTTVFWKEI